MIREVCTLSSPSMTEWVGGYSEAERPAAEPPSVDGAEARALELLAVGRHELLELLQLGEARRQRLVGHRAALGDAGHQAEAILGPPGRHLVAEAVLDRAQTLGVAGQRIGDRQVEDLAPPRRVEHALDGVA